MAPREPVDLGALYAAPPPMIQKAVTNYLTEYHRAYLEIATFFCLATGRQDAGLDASPRGGPPGFVRMLDATTLVFADWPGNNRIESLRNLQHDDRVAMLFLFPGLEVFMRINGCARISTASELLEELAEGAKQPKAAVVVKVEEALFHCGKAVNRARLWNPASQVDRASLPSVGTVLVALAGLSGVSASALDAKYDVAVKQELY
ncbi:pyridoxamine 5'-phosphate oxidase family protein [Variovorax sp. CYS-02]|uniref:Pyridoxamine 5'-phosphate oxidase family protein n=2 Tax=Variovorax terrae TaxID=2923278 RepID=A0A9X1VV23_9BURK|nr:MSMEG_1061 family FMN-dependent PPOX-type flavoprotein [Variovorax terrae]MCJ0763719.1 pyridoxamine 5'-phosphate oxidase family protein [Variovorax terrae]